jgi:hypothetical protein
LRPVVGSSKPFLCPSLPSVAKDGQMEFKVVQNAGFFVNLNHLFATEMLSFAVKDHA